MIRSIVDSLSSDLYNGTIENQANSDNQPQSTESPHIPSLLNSESVSTLSSSPSFLTMNDVSQEMNIQKDQPSFTLPKQPTFSEPKSSHDHRKKKKSSGSKCTNCACSSHDISSSSNNKKSTRCKNGTDKISSDVLKMAREQNLLWSSDDDADSDMTDWLLSDDDDEGLNTDLKDLIGSNQLDFLAKFVDSFASNSSDLKNLTALASGEVQQNGCSHACQHHASKPPNKSTPRDHEDCQQSVAAKKRKKKKKKTSSSEDSLPPDLVHLLRGGDSHRASGSNPDALDKDKALALLDLLSERIDEVAAGVSDIDLKNESNNGKKKKKKSAQPPPPPPPSRTTANSSTKPSQIWISAAPTLSSENTTTKPKKQRHISSSSSVSSNSNKSGHGRGSSTLLKELDEQVRAFVENPYVAEYRFQYTMSSEEETALITLACRYNLEVVHRKDGSERSLALKKINIDQSCSSQKHAASKSQLPTQSRGNSNNSCMNVPKANKDTVRKAGQSSVQFSTPSNNKKKKKKPKSNGTNSTMGPAKMNGSVNELAGGDIDSDESTNSVASLDDIFNAIRSERSKGNSGETFILDKLEKKATKAMKMMNRLTSCQEEYNDLMKKFSSSDTGCSAHHCHDCGGRKPLVEEDLGLNHHHHSKPESAKMSSSSRAFVNGFDECPAYDEDGCGKANKKKKRKKKSTKEEDDSFESLLATFANQEAVCSSGNLSDSTNRVEAVAAQKSSQADKKKCDTADAEIQTCPEGWYICYICEQELPEDQQLAHRTACLAQQREKLAQKTAEAEKRRQRRKQRMLAKQNDNLHQTNGNLNGESTAKNDRPCSIEDCTWKGKACHFCCSIFCGPHQLTHDCPNRCEPSVLNLPCEPASASSCICTDDISDNEEDDLTLEKEIAAVNQNLAIAASLSSNRTSDLTYFERCQLRKNLKMKVAAMRANRRR